MQRESDRFKVTFTIARIHHKRRHLASDVSSSFWHKNGAHLLTLETFALFEYTIVYVIFSEYKHQFVYPGD